MSNAQTIWNNLPLHHCHQEEWQPWLNLHGADGSLLDKDDTVSFINTKLQKAVKITINTEDNHPLSHWQSQFGDEESGIINVLNIVCSSSGKAVQDAVNGIFTDWLSK